MADIRADVEKAIEEIRVMLQSHGGDVELVEIDDDNVVKVRLTGACAGCPMAQQTLRMGVERQLKQMVPAVAAVEPADDEDFGEDFDEDFDVE